MQAVLLAAGRGSRLKPFTDQVPKPLVDVSGVCFLVNCLNALSKHKEVEEAIIIVGYKQDLIRKKIGAIFNGIKITYVENTLWEKTNNCYSLFLASRLITTDFILLEDDVFFEHRLLDPLFEERNKSIILLSKYESYMSGTLADVNKQTNIITNLLLNTMQKNLKKEDFYKTINICSFDYGFYKTYFEPLLKLHINHTLNSYWEIILGALIYLGTPNIYAHIVDNVKWFEVDNVDDLKIARKMFSNYSENY